MYYFEKIARSYDAKRKKQYRQMLKRMYGGNDEMIEGVKKNDANIYHGTSRQYMTDISRNGFSPDKNVHSQYGKGTYFADKNSAKKYTEGYFDSPKDAENQLMRLKRPSELKGTKILYGNPSNYKKVTDDVVGSEVTKVIQAKREGKGAVGAAASRAKAKRYLDIVAKSNMSDDDAAKHVLNKINKNTNGSSNNDLEDIKSHISKLRKGERAGKPVSGVRNIFRDRDNARLDKAVKEITDNKSKVERVKAYGKLNGEDMIRTPQYRANHLIATQHVPKELIVENNNPKGLAKKYEGRAIKVRKRVAKTPINTAQQSKSVVSALPQVKTVASSTKNLGGHAKTVSNNVRKFNPKIIGAAGAGIGIAGGAGYLAYKKHKNNKLEKKASYKELIYKEAKTINKDDSDNTTKTIAKGRIYYVLFRKNSKKL